MISIISRINVSSFSIISILFIIYVASITSTIYNEYYIVSIFILNHNQLPFNYILFRAYNVRPLPFTTFILSPSVFYSVRFGNTPLPLPSLSLSFSLIPFAHSQRQHKYVGAVNTSVLRTCCCCCCSPRIAVWQCIFIALSERVAATRRFSFVHGSLQ